MRTLAGIAGRNVAGPATAAADRVRRSHAQTRVTLRFASAFAIAGIAAAATGSSRWFALHLLLPGAVVLAISAVTLMLTVTWSAAPAPPERWVGVQRTTIAAGAAGIALGRRFDAPAGVLATAGVAWVTGLGVLAALLVVTLRAGTQGRFGPAVAAYLTALAAGVLGADAGIGLGTGVGSGHRLRDVHLVLELLGLVGLVIAGTLPYFAATVGRSRMSPAASPRRLGAGALWQAGTLAAATVAVLAGANRVAAAALVAHAAGIGAVLTVLPRPTGRQLRWAGPRLVGMWAGAVWWAAAVAATAADIAADRAAFVGRWLLVLVIAGYGQVLWSSLAYLLPVLRGGGHEHLAAGFVTTRSWTGLAAVNVAGFALAASANTMAAVAAAAWILDGAWRAARVGIRRAARPEEVR